MRMAFWTAATAVSLAADSRVFAAEVEVKNDSFTAPGASNIQTGFDANEVAAAWLTAPCNGNIVALRIFWRSADGSTGQSLEQSITVYDGDTGIFPIPGTQLLFLEGPVLTDGVMNEFRFIDEQNTIPISIPVTAGQTFVVAFRFDSDPFPFFGPSVCTDVGSGCQAGRNAIGPTWVNACSLGVTGDFIIRAVVDCAEPTGACCLPNGTCNPATTSSGCSTLGGTYLGAGSFCENCPVACCFPPDTCLDLSPADCALIPDSVASPAGSKCATFNCFPMGACCLPSGGCLGPVSPDDCAASGGNYQGDDTTCGGVSCPQPTGACCLSNGNCLPLSQSNCGSILNSVWRGPGTNCADANMSGRADWCESPCSLRGDLSGDGLRDAADIQGFVRGYIKQGVAGSPPFDCIDMNDDNVLNAADVALFQQCLLMGVCQ